MATPAQATPLFTGAARRATRTPFAIRLLLIYVGSETLFGKGPTYIGVPPVFWGEIVLLLSGVWALQRWNRVRLRDAWARALTGLICCFLLLAALELAVNLREFGIDAVRDSAACYYSLFFFVGLAIASDEHRMAVFASRWKVFWVLAVVWGVVDFSTGHVLPGYSPRLPYGLPVLSGSGSDLAQSMGLGALLLMTEERWRRYLATIPRMMLAALGLITLALYDARGVRIAISAAFVVTLAGSLRHRGASSVARQRLLLLALALFVVFAAALVTGIDIGRALTLSRFEGLTGDKLEQNAEWRAEWWGNITDAVMSQNPMLGLGFGDPLYEYNPFITELNEGRPVRAPHNYNVDIFARMGILGTLIWAGILVTGVFRPLWKILTAKTPIEQEHAKHLTFWVACLVAIWVNASFGVLMEGPVDAIPFWLIMGFVARGPKVTLRPVRFSPQAVQKPLPVRQHS